MTQRHLSRVLLSFLLVSVASCSGGGLALGPTTPSVNIEGVEFASFTLVNEERMSTAVAPELSRAERVAQLARDYSQQMRDEGFFSHSGPDGMTLKKRLLEAGIEFRTAAENLAKVTNSVDPAAFAHTLLLQQPQHRDNMLDSKYELLGVGAAKQGDTVWITQIFVER